MSLKLLLILCLAPAILAQEVGSGSGSGSGMGSGSGSGSGEEEIHDCGMLPLEPNQKLSSECDTILDTECFTECADGFESDDETISGNSYTCTESGWSPLNSLTCVEIDGCKNSPCLPEVSVCVDDAPPSAGYKCKCAEFAGQDGGHDETTGEGCAIARLFTREGNMTMQVGTGHDIMLQIGAGGSNAVTASLRSIVSTFADVDNQLDALFADLDDEAQNRAQEDQELSEIIGNLTDDHDGTLERVIGLESMVEIINSETGPIKSSVKANMERVQKLEDDLIDLLGDHSDLSDAHEVTKGQAQVLEQEVQTLRTDLSSEVGARSTFQSSANTRLSTLEANRALTRDLNTANTRISALQSIVNSLIAGGKHQSTPVARCSSLPRSSPSGVYWVKPTSRAAFQAYCDQDAGGGWMLTYSFHHVAGSNSGLPLSRMPLKDHDYTAMRKVRDIGITNWASISRVRFRCETSTHTRHIHFHTSQSNIRATAVDGYARGRNAFLSGSGRTLMDDHNGLLPGQAYSGFSGSNHGFWNFPMYRGANYHWAIRGQNYRFACDDYPARGGRSQGYAYTTTHQVWIRL